MKKMLFVGCMLAASTIMFGQTVQERISIKGGTSLWPNFVKEMYKYPAFVDGVVEYNNGQLFKRPMNYNKILATVQFIENGDTLALANEQNVKTVSIGTDVFVYRPKCYQDLSQGGKSKLLKSQTLRIADIRRVGAYGTQNSTSASESTNQMYISGNNLNLDVGETLLLYRVTSYLIDASPNEMLPATRKNVMMMYPKHEDKIRDFMKTKNTNMNKEEDVLELAQFLSQL